MFKKTAFLSLFIFLPAFFAFLLINRVKISQLEKDKFQITNPEAKMTTVLAASDEKTDLQIKSRESTLTLELPLVKSSVVKENNSLVVKNPASLIEYRYKPIPNGIKEEIILSQPPETNRFEVKMILEKLKMEKDGDGLPIFFDQNRNYRFHFQKPFAFDKNNQKTESLSYQIKTVKKNQEYKITLEIDKNWLNSSERAYPIIIDPTIIFDPQNAKPEVLEKRNAQTKTFSLGSGKFMATSYLDQVHFKDKNGSWQEIETNLNPTTENGFSFANISNNFKIFLAKIPPTTFWNMKPEKIFFFKQNR